MGIDRRGWLKALGAASATVAALPGRAAAAEAGHLSDDEAYGLLYDTTLCIGCQACVAACRVANGDEKPGPHALATDLDADTRNIIYAARDARNGGGFLAFMKRQCMHCAEPACASACMFGGLKKDEHGRVWWNEDLCVGCRYCQIACPFEVPRFEWDSVNPAIVKCELCRHRDEGPACAEVCPRDAVIFGTRTELLAEARRRMAAAPDRYIPRIYGETDAGGTQVLYISHVPFEALGLPEVGDRPLPDYTEQVHGLIWKGAVIPSAVYALLGLAVFRSNRSHGEVDA